MDLGLAGKVVLVTGGSRGIGRAIAIAFAEEGAKVSICARGQADLETAKAALDRAGPGPHVSVISDLTTAEGVDYALAQTKTALGNVNVLVNNVGGSGARHFDEADEIDFAQVMSQNFWPALRMSQRVVAQMRQCGDGVIIMIASIWGREAGGGPSYNVAKAAEISLAKAIARDLAKDGIRVNAVAPGSILFPSGGWDRRMRADPKGIADFVRRELPFGRFGKPEEVASAVVFLSSARASWISGACLTVDGCQSRAF